MIDEGDNKYEKLVSDVKYEKLFFDEMNANPYEIVVAVARTARDINDKAHKYLSPETEIRPTALAMKKLSGENVKFVYEELSENRQPGEL